LGKYLNRQQIDFVIAHELAHVQQKHGRKKWLLTTSIFFAMTVVVFFFRRDLIVVRPLVNALIILVPLGMFYLFSRRYEYEADRNALDFTGDPESGMRAIAGLRRVTGEPMQCSRFTEIFLTHPAFARRIEAIGRAGGVPLGRTVEILRLSCPSANNRESHPVTRRG
jgi:Zn-dependent protease with chaperone function